MPKALQVGCSPHEFWEENPKLFWLRLRAYNETKTEEIKMWQMQTNTSAWIQGQYLLRAIEAALPKGRQYPEKPIPIFKDDESTSEKLSDEDVQAQKILENEKAIRERSIQIDAMLSKNKKISAEIVGEKRI